MVRKESFLGGKLVVCVSCVHTIEFELGSFYRGKGRAFRCLAFVITSETRSTECVFF